MSARRFWSRLRRVPRAAVVCGALAFLNGACWAVITPTFWTPDEPGHVGYVQRLAEAGELPNAGAASVDAPSAGLAEEQVVVYGALPFSVEGRPSWSGDRDEDLQRTLASGTLERTRPGQAVYIGNHPPLYYLLETIPYRAAHSAGFLDRLLLMRLFSALLAGFTVFWVFLFLRELLPRTEWAWTVGALAVAFQPLLGFLAGGVTNDNLVYTVSAALFYSLARGFRRGLSVPNAALIGVCVAAGLLTKANFATLVPGVLFALAAMVIQARPAERRAVGVAAGVALASAAVPWLTWGLASKLIFGSAPGAAQGVGTGAVVDGAGSLLTAQLGYVWQTFLPRLPFMFDHFPWYPLWEVHLKGFIGRLGWAEFGFPAGWYWVALAICLGILGLAATSMVRGRRALVARWPEVLTYAAMVGGLTVGLALVAYGYHRSFGGFVYLEQPRYLLPLVPLYGALVALAARGGGLRWGRPLGAFLVVLAMGHSLFAQLLTISRFYA